MCIFLVCVRYLASLVNWNLKCTRLGYVRERRYDHWFLVRLDQGVQKVLVFLCVRTVRRMSRVTFRVLLESNLLGVLCFTIHSLCHFVRSHTSRCNICYYMLYLSSLSVVFDRWMEYYSVSACLCLSASTNRFVCSSNLKRVSPEYRICIFLFFNFKSSITLGFF